jgi:hypothetical protein
MNHVFAVTNELLDVSVSSVMQLALVLSVAIVPAFFSFYLGAIACVFVITPCLVIVSTPVYL